MLASVLYRRREVLSKRTSPAMCLRRCCTRRFRLRSVKSIAKGLSLLQQLNGRSDSLPAISVYRAVLKGFDHPPGLLERGASVVLAFRSLVRHLVVCPDPLHMEISEIGSNLLQLFVTRYQEAALKNDVIVTLGAEKTH